MHINYSEKSTDFKNAFLGRLVQDCDYVLNGAQGNTSRLFYDNVQEHVQEMIKLYNTFGAQDRPRWLTHKQLKKLCNRMLRMRINKRFWG